MSSRGAMVRRSRAATAPGDPRARRSVRGTRFTIGAPRANRHAVASAVGRGRERASAGDCHADIQIKETTVHSKGMSAHARAPGRWGTFPTVTRAARWARAAQKSLTDSEAHSGALVWPICRHCSPWFLGSRSLARETVGKP